MDFRSTKRTKWTSSSPWRPSLGFRSARATHPRGRGPGRPPGGPACTRAHEAAQTARRPPPPMDSTLAASRKSRGRGLCLEGMFRASDHDRVRKSNNRTGAAVQTQAGPDDFSTWATRLDTRVRPPPETPPRTQDTPGPCPTPPAEPARFPGLRTPTSRAVPTARSAAAAPPRSSAAGASGPGASSEPQRSAPKAVRGREGAQPPATHRGDRRPATRTRRTRRPPPRAAVLHVACE